MDIKETIEALKDTLGLEPQKVAEGIFIPSESSLKVAAPSKTNYDNTVYDAPYAGSKKILMVCTEQQYMTMANGKKFDTGNHPVEMMVPMLHFKAAGFEVDIFTPTGQPVKIEQWAMPNEDEDVNKIHEAYKVALENPKSIKDFVEKEMAGNDDYLAIFIPGGHGAMLGLPEDENLGKLLRWGRDEDLFTLVICHGPAALLSASIKNNTDSDKDGKEHAKTTNQDFIFKGYEMVAFTDAMDKQMPKLGYLPGDMPWYFNEKLEELGVTITNKLAMGHTHQDRKLISGDGPLAANDFGKLCANELLKVIREA